MQVRLPIFYKAGHANDESGIDVDATRIFMVILLSQHVERVYGRRATRFMAFSLYFTSNIGSYKS